MSSSRDLGEQKISELLHHEFAERRTDFAFETTLAGKTYVSLFRQLKQQGYAIHLFFLWIASVELAVVRIKTRVAEGGHDVPVMDIRRRFGRSVENFFTRYRPLLTSWTFFDNSTTQPSLIAEEKQGKLTVVDTELFRKILRAMEG